MLVVADQDTAYDEGCAKFHAGQLVGNGALNDKELCTAAPRQRPRREENMRRQIEWPVRPLFCPITRHCCCYSDRAVD